MSNPFSPGLTKIDKIRLQEFEAERLAQEKKEQDEANWKETHCAPNSEGEWEC